MHFYTKYKITLTVFDAHIYILLTLFIQGPTFGEHS